MSTSDTINKITAVAGEAADFWNKVSPFLPMFIDKLPAGETKQIIATVKTSVDTLAGHHDQLASDASADRLAKGLKIAQELVEPLLPTGFGGPLFAAIQSLEPLVLAGIAELQDLGKTAVSQTITDTVPVDEDAPA